MKQTEYTSVVKQASKLSNVDIQQFCSVMPSNSSFIDKSETSFHRIRSVLTEVVRVLESTKVQEIELAEQVKTILSENFSSGDGDEEEAKTPPQTLPPPLPPRLPLPPTGPPKTKTLSLGRSPSSISFKVFNSSLNCISSLPLHFPSDNGGLGLWCDW